MVMNEKVAMALCAAVIVGMPCGLQRFVAPSQVPSPLGEPRPGMPAAADRGPRSDADPRTAWVRRFQRPSPFETHAGIEQPKDALALLTQSEPPPGVAEPISLPPVYPEEPALAAVAAPDPTEALADSAEAVLAAADVSPVDPPVTEPKRYRVVKGDTLVKIARREWNSDDRRLVALLGDANPQVRERKNRILAGEDLIIPDAASVQIALGVTTPAMGPVLADAGPAKAEVDAALGTGKTAGQRWYTIQRKDTLASIARRFLNDGQRWREIVALNRALNPHRIVPGMRIKLPPMLRLAQS
jgi:nucleoid-associated protein YgaU